MLTTVLVALWPRHVNLEWIVHTLISLDNRQKGEACEYNSSSYQLEWKYLFSLWLSQDKASPQLHFSQIPCIQRTHQWFEELFHCSISLNKPSYTSSLIAISPYVIQPMELKALKLKIDRLKKEALNKIIYDMKMGCFAPFLCNNQETTSHINAVARWQQNLFQSGPQLKQIG